MNAIAWEKRGLIVPSEGAPAWRATHSGMVSALERPEGGYRLFLTGRDADRSYHIGWLDLDDRFQIVHEPRENPVLTRGRMGCFDCQGLCMPAVVRVSDSLLYLYYAGWGLTAKGFFTNQCGLAISRDNGQTWQRWSEAPLALLDAADPIGIGTVFVLRESPDFWRMWYTTFREWRLLPEGKWRHYYRIKYAESDDGIHWRKPPDNLAIDFQGDREFAIGRPMVVRESDGYRMWFSSNPDGTTYRIGYAESRDGRSWTRLPSGLERSATGWDSEMVEYSYVVKRGEEYRMFYNGNKWGASGTGLAIGRAS